MCLGGMFTINLLIFPVANSLNFFAMCLWCAPSMNSGQTHLTKLKKSSLALFCIFFSACKTCNCLNCFRMSAGSPLISTLFKFIKNFFKIFASFTMFKTNLPPLTVQIKQFNLKLWDPFYKKGCKGVVIYSSLGLGLVPLLQRARARCTWLVFS